MTGAWKCRFFGHKEPTLTHRQISRPDGGGYTMGVGHHRCPRCGATWVADIRGFYA